MTDTSPVMLVTGGTGGIGKETARGLAATGAEVLVTGRDADRGRAAVDDIRVLTGNRAVHFMSADLSSRADVRRLADEVADRFRRLDVLVNNVGGLYRTRWETVDGVEAHLAMNHLNPFLLTHLLLPLLHAGTPSRIVNVSSGGHRWPRLRVDDLERRGHFVGLDVYGHAKLLHVITTLELAERLDGSGVVAHLADPGGAWTDMTAAMTPDMLPRPLRLVWPLGRRFQQGQTTDTAAHSSILAATDPGLGDLNGLYLSAKGKPVRPRKLALDPQLRRRVWDQTLQLLAIDDATRSLQRSP